MMTGLNAVAGRPDLSERTGLRVLSDSQALDRALANGPTKALDNTCRNIWRALQGPARHLPVWSNGSPDTRACGTTKKLTLPPARQTPPRRRAH